MANVILRGPAKGAGGPRDDLHRSGRTIADIAGGDSGMTIEFQCDVIPGREPGIHACLPRRSRGWPGQARP